MSAKIQKQADELSRKYPNHVVGSVRQWHWSYYHSGYGLAEGWATSERAAEAARNRAIGELVGGSE